MSASGGYGPAAICAGIVGHVNRRKRRIGIHEV
jgi:hypothetical protein